jgi:hypothetical protein
MLARCITRTSHLQTYLQLLKVVFVFKSIRLACLIRSLHQSYNVEEIVHICLYSIYKKCLRILTKSANPLSTKSIHSRMTCYKPVLQGRVCLYISVLMMQAPYRLPHHQRMHHASPTTKQICNDQKEDMM